MIINPTAPATTVGLDPISLLLGASLPVKLTVALLLVSGTGVWLIALLKFLQLGRLRTLERRFEREVRAAPSGPSLYAAAGAHPDAPGARIVLAMAQQGRGHFTADRLRAIASRAVVSERLRAGRLLSILGSIASSAPFIGLFGTVYGIMDAFIRIGHEKSASLPVVAPAIGEALVTTAIGLAAAIPALIFYNAIDQRVSELLEEVEAATEEWVLCFASRSYEDSPTQERAVSSFPARAGAAGSWASKP